MHSTKCTTHKSLCLKVRCPYSSTIALLLAEAPLPTKTKQMLVKRQETKRKIRNHEKEARIKKKERFDGLNEEFGHAAKMMR